MFFFLAHIRVSPTNLLNLSSETVQIDGSDSSKIKNKSNIEGIDGDKLSENFGGHKTRVGKFDEKVADFNLVGLEQRSTVEHLVADQVQAIQGSSSHQWSSSRGTGQLKDPIGEKFSLVTTQK
jgi:hypothetical protein